MEAFEDTALPARVIFGFGTLPRAADELAALGCKQPFVLSDKAADVALESYWNPRPVERGPIRALLDDAYRGRRPSRTGV